MPRFGDDDTANNIDAQRQQDAMPTDEELEEAADTQERRKALIETLVTEGAEAGLIDKVIVAQGRARPDPNSLGEVANELGYGEEYDELLANASRRFLSPGITGAAEDAGLPVDDVH